MRSGRPLVLVPAASSIALSARQARSAQMLVTECAAVAERIGGDVRVVASERGANVVVRLVSRVSGATIGASIVGLLRSWNASEIYVRGDDFALATGLVHRVLRRRERLVAVLQNIDVPQRRRWLKSSDHRPYKAIIVANDVQRRILVDDLRFPESKVHRLHEWVDVEFFDPDSPGAVRPRVDMLSPDGYVLALCSDACDITTLVEAVRGSGVRLHIVDEAASTEGRLAIPTLPIPTLPIPTLPNVSVGSNYSPTDLRDLYRHARFVVVSLNDVPHSAGAVIVLEAMAMGKAVVATESRGVREYLRDGQLGRVVPVGDARALRDALEDVWNDDERRAHAAADNREWASKVCDLDTYVDHVAALFG